jgi:drug/metabolite transporter (DMT)-like permease
VLAVLLALASAIGYGSSDFAAGLASRDVSVIGVTLFASVISTAIVAAALPFAASPGPSAAALAWGFGAGLGGTLGALALYLGFRYAAFSVAGPLSAVGSAGFSVLAGLLYGERPTALALAGIVLALPAIVAVSVSADEGPAADPDGGGRGGTARGVVLGLVAGACFALLFIGLDRAGSGSGMWPVAAAAVGEVAAALTAAIVAAIVAGRAGGAAEPGSGVAEPGSGAAEPGSGVAGGGPRLARGFRLTGGRPRLLAVISGVSAAAGIILFFFATHQGLLAVTSVLASLYPAVTIVLARTVLGERLTALRLGGLALAGVCVSLIAVGGSG